VTPRTYSLGPLMAQGSSSRVFRAQTVQGAAAGREPPVPEGFLRGGGPGEKLQRHVRTPLPPLAARSLVRTS